MHELCAVRARRDVQDCVKLLRSLEHFNVLAHARLCDSTTAKDLDGVVCNLAREAGRLHLEERNLSREVG